MSLQSEIQEFSRAYLVVGLGNPGKVYEQTRHNVGFLAADLLVEKNHWVFRRQLKWKGSVSQGRMSGADVILLKPLTFMNRSGEAVALVMNYFKIQLSHLLVIVDDIALPLGQLRMRAQGGSGGHNGLKSIAEHLQTDCFARLRVGIGNPQEEDLAHYVLQTFSFEEKRVLSEVFERSRHTIELWIEKDVNHAMDYANRPVNPRNGE